MVLRMPKARTVLPIDLLALVSYNGKVYPNEARPRERIGAAETTPNAIETAMDQWFSFATRRNAWISASRRRLRGLVSARRRGGRQAWEIDCVIDTTTSHDAVPGLLDCAVEAGGKAGAEKIFVRMGANSSLLPVIINAGFTAYQSEHLYVGSALALDPPDVGLRAFSQPDMYPAFRLYNSVLPERSRRAEAATFGEWQAALEKRWLKSGVELVLESEGGLAAHVRAARLPHGVLVDLTADSSGAAHATALLAAAVKGLPAGPGPVMVLLPESAGGVASRLQEAGFERREDFVALMCRTTRVARLTKLVPKAIPNAAVTT